MAFVHQGINGSGKSRVSRILGKGGLAACAFAWLFAPALMAQEYIRYIPVPVRTSNQPGANVYATDELEPGAQAPNPAASSSPLSPEEADQLIQQYKREAGSLGPNRLFSATNMSFRAGVGIAYDDNIRINTGSGKQGDEIISLNGGATLSLGDYLKKHGGFLIFDYACAENLFVNHSGQDAFDQDAFLDGQYRWDRLSVELISRFQVLHDASYDIDQRERRYIYDEALRFTYHYSDKIDLLSRFNYDSDDPSTGESNQQYSWENALDYQVWDKVKLGAGLVIGRLEAQGQSGETFEQPLARFTYQATDKVFVLAQGGLDIRERGSSADDKLTPVFTLEALWTPDLDTTASVSGYRQVDASESVLGQDFTETTVKVAFRRRFLKRYFAVASAQYTHADYERVTFENLPVRTDDYYTVRIGCEYQAVKFLDLSLFYRRQQDASTWSVYSYASNRVYFEAKFVF